MPPAPCAAHIHLRLPADPESVAAAHRSVFGVASVLHPDVLDDVRLLVSELVTNAILHAGLGDEDWIDLEVDADGRRVRVEVRDPGPGFDPGAIPGGRPPFAPGWGLVFVRELATRWGVDPGARNRVWVELDNQPAGRRDRFVPSGHG